MEYLDRDELIHAQRQAQEMLAILNAVSRFCRRCRRGLGSLFSAVRLAQKDDSIRLLHQAYLAPFSSRRP